MLNGVLSKLRCTLVLALFASCALADDVLRMQKDAARGRAWLLTPHGLMVLDERPRRSSFVALPGWLWAGEAYLCPPDLALAPDGAAVVSSNVVPWLWRVDPVSLRATRHELALDTDAGRDVGFTGLAWAEKLGAYVAVADAGTLWRIDPLLRRAQKVQANAFMPRACGIAPLGARRASRLFGLCVRGSGERWTVHFSPDQRAAYVRPGC